MQAQTEETEPETEASLKSRIIAFSELVRIREPLSQEQRNRLLVSANELICQTNNK